MASDSLDARDGEDERPASPPGRPRPDEQTPAHPPSQGAPDTVAAIDLGSNSFHMIVGRVTNGDLQVVDRLREMVRLGAGLDERKMLRPEAADLALACLERFGQRLRAMPPGSVRAVGTNTLRQMRDSVAFLEAAQAALGHPIEVIAGREEARLVYLGVAHGLAAGDERRLVVDIGGGSTEVIVGDGFTARERESLYMGCVSMSRAYFGDGRITAAAMNAAETAGALELRPVKAEFRDAGWQLAVGSSGTIKAIEAACLAAGWAQQGISYEALRKLRKALIDAGSVDKLELGGVAEERRPVFPGGVAVLLAVFKALNIDHMMVSDQALREGLLYEMLGRIRHEDVRERTVRALRKRYKADKRQARRVETTARALLSQTARDWGLAGGDYADMLGWAARLHEIGLAVSHSQFHKHGAYLIANSDLSGFSRQEQGVLAALVRGHRRKFPVTAFDQLPQPTRGHAKRLCILLRLAILLHRARSPMTKPNPLLKVEGNRLVLRFPDDWLDRHPLTRAELELENSRITNAGIQLDFA
ncbi:MAG: exopolyphosphatase [Chromatiales bacterium]|jgi:exopolyphosphatase/guanosine-5'-triphosphate,3'-diphosphate pyrophosphatase